MKNEQIEIKISGQDRISSTLREFAIDWNNAPDLAQLRIWDSEGGCEATDGCWVKPDGICEHGAKSWLLELNLI